MIRIDPHLAGLIRRALDPSAAETELDPLLDVARPWTLSGEPGDAGVAALVGPLPRTEVRIDIIVAYTGDLADLAAHGFEMVTVAQTDTGLALATGHMPLQRVLELEDVPHVVKVEGPSRRVPALNRSVPEIRAKLLHDAVPSVKGKGVVVGIVDTGIDFYHHVFRNADGTTRILGIWDQTVQAKVGETKGIGGVGIEYTADDINGALQGGPDLRTKDIHPRGHGTHVAAIAAGDGSQKDGCRGEFTYVGVAPEADLVVVKYNFQGGVHTSRAAEYIYRIADAEGKPAVVNMSFGHTVGGAHDGNTLEELLLDTIVNKVAGRVLVAAAGNERGRDMSGLVDQDRHAEATVPAANSINLPFTVPPSRKDQIVVELWYPGAASLTTSVWVDAFPAPLTLPPISPGDSFMERRPIDPASSAPTLVTIASLPNDPINGDKRIVVILDSSPGSVVLPGNWRLQLTNASASPVRFDAWIANEEDSPTARFTALVTEEKTLFMPATARSAITVAAYTEPGFLFFNWTGDIATFSSYGPTRDARLESEQKPDIAAPGVGIYSARPTEKSPSCCACCINFYQALDGTSQAAPHVAGVAALMLQKNRGLTAAEVKAHLRKAARTDGYTGAVPNTKWGAGKLDAFAAYSDVQASPPSPPVDADAAAPPALRQPPVEAVAGGSGGYRGHLDTGSAPSTALLNAVQRLAGEDFRVEAYAALVSRHFSEVRALITNNRRVGMRWQRMDGPRLLSFAAEWMSGADKMKIQGAELNLPALRKRAAAFLAELEEHASPPLQADIQRYRHDLIGLDPAALLGYSSSEQV